jgi:hypothetical protein
MVGEGCKGTSCKYFRRFYATQYFKGGYMPDFSSVDEYCSHPSIYVPDSKLHSFEHTGKRLQTIKCCPKR